jgi:HEAT repeat protein
MMLKKTSFHYLFRRHQVLAFVLLFISVSSLVSCSSYKYAHLLDSGEITQRRKAAEDIQMLGTRGWPAHKALSKAAEDSDPELRRLAVEAIGGLGKKAFDEAWVLIRALRDKDVHVRRAAVVALSNLHQFPTAAFPPVINCLGDQDSLVRELTINTFEGLGTAGVGTLARALNNKNVQIRRSAVTALGRLGPEACFAMEALKQAGRDSDNEVSRLASDTVKKLAMSQTRIKSY